MHQASGHEDNKGKVAHEQDGAVIVVTHDQRALDVFDTIYEMEDGKIERKSDKPN
ncbi:MAG: hypothetical protein V1758_05885 [Pseudomonadota bacterium]